MTNPSKCTALRIQRDLAWFRIRGYGFWLKWGCGRDLFSTRRTAHYVGQLRWKVLRPEPKYEHERRRGRCEAGR